MRRSRAARNQGPLAGLPVAHKDLVPTRGVRTTFGSRIYRDFVPDADAILVERLREAGAIMIGKTNTPEFGAGSQTFNAVFGATRNPYDLGKTCGGIERRRGGGPGRRLAADRRRIGPGREPAQSRELLQRGRPASLAPAACRTGRASPPGSTCRYLGPMARTVADVALLLSAMAGPDARAPLCLEEPGSVFRAPLGRDFKGTRIAWSPDLGGLPVEPEVARRSRRSGACSPSSAASSRTRRPDLRDADEVFRVLRAWDYELALRRSLAQHRALMKDTVIWNIEEGARLTGPQVGAAEVKRTALYHRMREFMRRYDYLVAPVAQVLPFDVGIPYVTRIKERRIRHLPRLDAVLLLHHRHGRAGDLGALRLQRRRAPGRPANRRAPSAGNGASCRWRTPSSRRPGCGSGGRRSLDALAARRRRAAPLEPRTLEPCALEPYAPQNFIRAVRPKVRGAPRNASIWLNWNGASNATW